MLTMFEIEEMEQQMTVEHQAHMQRHKAYLESRIRILQLVALAKVAQPGQVVEE